MAGKIPKNLSDQDMVKEYCEKIVSETDEQVKFQPQSPKNKNTYVSEFFTPELQEQVGKALLDLKVKLFKEGIVDFNIKVSSKDNQVVLTPVPQKKNKNGM